MDLQFLRFPLSAGFLQFLSRPTFPGEHLFREVHHLAKLLVCSHSNSTNPSFWKRRNPVKDNFLACLWRWKGRLTLCACVRKGMLVIEANWKRLVLTVTAVYVLDSKFSQLLGEGYGVLQYWTSIVPGVHSWLPGRGRTGVPDLLPAELTVSALLAPLTLCYSWDTCLLLVGFLCLWVRMDPMQIPVFLAYFWHGVDSHSFEAYWMRLHSTVPTTSEGWKCLSLSFICPLALHMHSIDEHFIHILIP